MMSVKIVWGNQPHISSSQNSFLLPAINFEDKIHQYYSAIPDDSFARLYKTLTDKKREQIQFKNEREALAALLHDLNISKHSQVLVFSNTSLQLSKISAKSPRAVYFNDDLYVGYVPGGFIEIIGIDSRLGAIPYLFKLPQKGNSQYPPIRRSTRCMRCHASEQTGQVPGLLLSSVIPAETGGSLDNLNPHKPGHHLPYSKRFGGWFITDQNETQNNWANSIGKMKQGGEVMRRKIPIPYNFIRTKHLSQKSEFVSHLILEHQIGFTNLCITVQYAYRECFARPSKYNYQEMKAYYISELIKYCLFRDEPTLENFQMNETKYFRNYFERTHQNTHQLRKLDLKTRLFKTRCSYMLGSRVFNELPDSFKITFLDSLKEAISNKESAYANLTDHLGLEERKTILKVLHEL